MKYIIGADEVGRGCVAGDVVVAAVMVAEDSVRVEGVRDSKKLSPVRRELVCAKLLADPSLRYKVVFRPASDVDKRGISAVLRDCFEEAVSHLLNLEPEGTVEVRIDGTPFPVSIQSPVQFIVKGDDKEYTIGAASIIAKVARDAYMVEQGSLYPGYGFETHAGYGTRAHIEAIKKLGLSPIHRTTFCRAWVPQTVSVFEDAGILDLFGG